MRKINLTLTILLSLGFVSCSSLSPIRVKVINPAISAPLKRSDKFFNCLVKLNQEGFRQSLIVNMCESTLGSIND